MFCYLYLVSSVTFNVSWQFRFSKTVRQNVPGNQWLWFTSITQSGILVVCI
uniref:Uncharacterized protein n=1 Tax=Anguilla anguilla TaxID=7936 RepID=A0A0E9WW24_ANGAN